MTEEATKQPAQEKSEAPAKAESTSPAKASTGGPDQKRRPGGRDNRRGGRGGDRGGRGGRRRMPRADVPAESDYEEKNIEVNRVTRVTKGGKRMRFRVLAVIGNHKGRVGYGLSKGTDVASASSKATNKARKSLITVPIVNETIPHAVRIKHGAAQIVLKPAPKGTGVKAGGPVRSVLELAGIPNITAKILGTKNKVNNIKAIFEALSRLKAPPEKEGKAKEEIGEKKEEKTSKATK